MAENTHTHSHSHSSSKRRRSSDVKAYRKSRYFFAFILFITLTAFAFSTTAKACPLDRDRVAEIFTNHTYAEALSDDVTTYAEDMCRRYSVPSSAVSPLDFETVDEINRAYIIGALSLDEKYTETTYTNLLAELETSLESSINHSVKANNLRVADGNEDGAKFLAEAICGYLSEQMTFPYLDKVETVINLGSTVAFAVMVIGLVLTVALVLIVIALGSELYRNIRSVTHAVSASALSCYLVSVAYVLVRSTKDLYIFPTYLKASVMRYLDASAGALALTGALLTAVSFAVMAVVWKLKSDALDAPKK